MILQSDDISSWFDSIADVEPEYIPIKVWSSVQFFKIDGRKTNLCKDNLVPIKDVKYVVLSPQEKRYYLRTYRNYPLAQIYFYEKDNNFGGHDVSVESLRRYIQDGNVHLLFTPEQMEETKLFLQRLWRSQFTSDGQVRYRDYIDLLTQSIDLEDYKDYSHDLTGHKTVENQFRMRIKAIWDRAAKKNT